MAACSPSKDVGEVRRKEMKQEERERRKMTREKEKPVKERPRLVRRVGGFRVCPKSVDTSVSGEEIDQSQRQAV